MPNTFDHRFLSESNVDVEAPIAGDSLQANGVGRWYPLKSLITLADTPNPSLDASMGWIFTLRASGDRTIGIPINSISGRRIIIMHTALGSNRSLTLSGSPGGFRFGSDVTGLTPTVSTKTDYIGAIYNALDNYWDVVSVVKGY